MSSFSQLKKQRREEQERNEEEDGRRFVEREFVSEVNDDSNLDVSYCSHCGAFSLISDVSLSSLPCRRSDGALVLDRSAHTCRVMMIAVPDRTAIRRSGGGIEVQYRYVCKACSLLLAYQQEAHSSQYEHGRLYLLPDALSSDPTAYLAKFELLQRSEQQHGVVLESQ